MADEKPRIRVSTANWSRRTNSLEESLSAQAYDAARRLRANPPAVSDAIKSYEMSRGRPSVTAATADSFQNYSLNIGLGTNNALSDSTWGFLPITRDRTLLEWIYR